MGDSRIKVSTGALAPGGNIQCGCCGSSSCGNDDMAGITGLDYMNAMIDAIPNIFDKIDFLASHSYPADGIGYGFNVPFDESIIGLEYYKKELDTIGRSLQVLVTETGWATNPPGGLPTCTEIQKANWTANAYNYVWHNDSRIMGIMPFMLQDSYWGDQLGYEYVNTNGNVAQVFSTVQQLRCKWGFLPTC